MLKLSFKKPWGDCRSKAPKYKYYRPDTCLPGVVLEPVLELGRTLDGGVCFWKLSSVPNLLTGSL